MIQEYYATTKHWRLIHLLGTSTLRSRYAHSKLGQTWLTLSTLIQILLTGTVWSLLWKMNLHEYLPYLGVGQIIFIFFSQTINESCSIFINDSRIYMNDKLPFMVSVSAHIYRNGLILLHNLPILLLLLIWAQPELYPPLFLQFILAIPLSLVFLVFTSYFLAMICSRFRDLIQLVALFIHLAFLISPLMWHVSIFPETYRAYLFINPFASVLELLRNPLLGLPIHSWALPSLGIWVIVTALLAFIAHKKMEKQLIFWI